MIYYIIYEALIGGMLMIKKVLKILFVTLLVLNSQNIANAALNKTVPDTIVLHQAIDGEEMVDILRCTAKPKVNLSLHKYPMDNSEVVAKAYQGDDLRIVAYELHTYPKENMINSKIGPYAILSYRGEGDYTIYKDGIVRTIATGTNKYHVLKRPDLWLCLRSSSGLEGWTKFKTRDDWFMSQHYGIFHPISRS